MRQPPFCRTIAILAAVLCPGTAAIAQSIAPVSLRPAFEIATEENRRGVSWSEGRAAISADFALEAGALGATARLVTLRDAGLHGEADTVIDLGLSATQDVGPFAVTGQGIVHLFTGAFGKQDYAEAGVTAAYTLGPVRVSGGGFYAPEQSAIGGSNLYLFAGADAGIPATPLTLYGHVGRSSGDVDDTLRANRLRPGGRYSDWRVGVDHVTGPLAVSLEYVGTDIPDEAARGDHDDRLVARARFSF
ncbi:TorF family putative porin [Croceibacterium ferulae]|uniref:TorF family putative porin n=1 Tax=Croceibacterium ferulae TaxID=1854641 RepID=UPI000EB34272|nr:TorF family putative porin [Croceibacterium ferulae]